MATLATGNVTGGVKKSSGCVIDSSLAAAWARVRDDSDASCTWMLSGYAAGSKTKIEVVAAGSGSLEDLREELRKESYGNVVVFGGFKDSDGKFVHISYACVCSCVIQVVLAGR